MVFSQNSENKKLRKSESPEVPKGTFRDCKQSPRSRASPDFGSSPIQKEFLASMYKGETRLKPRNFGDFQRYPQSAYVQYASIVCLENHRIICG